MRVIYIEYNNSPEINKVFGKNSVVNYNPNNNAWEVSGKGVSIIASRENVKRITITDELVSDEEITGWYIEGMSKDELQQKFTKEEIEYIYFHAV